MTASAPDRRAFLATVTAAAFAGAPWVRRPSAYDLVIRDGRVVDGTGSPAFAADIAVRGDRIAAVGRRLAGRGTEEIRATGLAVSPGFIDIHSHGDGGLLADPRQESVIRQGITTIVVGQDGGSRAPQPRGAAGEDGPESFHAVFATFDQLQPSVNIASMVGLGSVRGAVVGEADRPATAEELSRMVGLVEAALAEGACGASSGLEYTPGAFASLEELIALCRPLAARRLPYATHMRNEDDRVLESIDESIAVARGAGCPLQLAHLKMQGPRNWPRLDDAVARIATARSAGLDVAFDRYPYIAYQTGLTNLFPTWSRDGGTDAFLARLDSAETLSRMREHTLAKVELIGGWDNVQITSVREDADKPAEGKRLGSYARALGQDPFVLTVTMLQRNRAMSGMVGFAMSEDNLDRLLAHPQGMVCSDGGAFAVDGPTRRGSPHPRGAGSFPRVLARYVRERKVLTLPQAVHKMTALPASRVRLRDRGRIATGLAADLVVFDSAAVADTATFEQPFAYPVGIAAVVVNGSVAVRDGTRAERRTGRTLRPA